MCASSRSNYCISIHLARRREAARPRVFTVWPSVCTYAISINIYSAIFFRSGRTCGFALRPIPSSICSRMFSMLAVWACQAVPEFRVAADAYSWTHHTHTMRRGVVVFFPPLLSGFLSELWRRIACQAQLTVVAANTQSGNDSFQVRSHFFFLPTVKTCRLFSFFFYIKKQRFNCLKQLEAPSVRKT